MFDVTALGEILIDFTPVRVFDKTFFEKNPGGAPANLAVGVARLGGKSAFIGKAGSDNFGYFLKSVLKTNNVDTSGFVFDRISNTTLAFVELDEKGERSFTFYRNPGADTCLKPREINYRLIKESKIFHFGSLSMTVNPSLKSTFCALRFAKKSKCIISFDPNLRPVLWKDLSVAKKRINKALNYVDILKLSDEELFFITGKNSIKDGVNDIKRNFGVKLILVTLGGNGAFYSFDEINGKVDAFKTTVVDTTGAGDSFFAAFLFYLIKKDIFYSPSKKEIEKAVIFANASAAITVSRRGAIPALPDLEEVKKFLNVNNYKDGLI